MWRITKLVLKNVTYLQSGLNKDHIEIDFTKANANSKLNLIIGPMGSGKSVILGHLQPFASFGTLDARNSENMILPERDGLKIIEYDHDTHHYVIHHDYVWNKNMHTHNVKSYIEKDGVELNSNGNSGSFKEIIKTEFGIDQSFLRVLRLGPNVANVISMKSTERKSFIASLQEDTEMYLMIYKKLTADYRVLKASITSVSNRLMQLSSTKADDMRNELSSLLDESDALARDVESYTSEIAGLQGVNNAICGGSPSTLESMKSQLSKQIESLEESIADIDREIQSVKNSGETLSSISVKIGGYQAECNAYEANILNLQKLYETQGIEIDKLTDAILAHGNDTHLSEMRNMVAQLEADYNKYSIQLDGFQCKYTYEFLAKFIDDLNVLKAQVEELSQLDEKRIHFLLANIDKSITTYVNEKVSILTGRKVNLQKSLSNIQFSSEYIPPFPIFRDPRCTFDQCPYFTTHPVTVQKDIGSKAEKNAALARINDEITRVDTEIAKFQELPMLQKQFQLLRNLWASAHPVLLDLGCIDPRLTLSDLLIDMSLRSDWYHYNQLIHILEKCKMQSEYESVASRYAAVKNEIAILESSGIESYQDRLAKVKADHAETRAQMAMQDDQLASRKRMIEDCELLYANLQKMANSEIELRNCQESLTAARERFAKTTDDIDLVQDNIAKIKALELKKFEKSAKFKDLSQKIERLKTILSQIEYSQQEYDDLIKDNNVMRAILDAVSAKKGIPLILVRHFLSGCKDIVNDLISEIFDDDLEILDFDVTEDDFKIPYMVNGQVISDISFASQGQQSIISIALSFALVRQSMFDYNIMLLDEIDGPLHKNDREKFIGILFRQMAAIQADQVFLISHNSTFEGNPVNILMTADEDIEKSSRQVVIRI